MQPPPLPVLSYRSPPPIRPGAIASWVFIIMVCVALPVLNEIGARASPAPIDPDAPRAANWQLTVQGRYVVGAADMMGRSKDLLEAFDATSGSSDEQIALAILEGELLGRDAAIKRLEALGTGDASAVMRIYARASDAAPATQPSGFVERYPWYADLARSLGRDADDPLRAGVLDQARTVFGVIIGAVTLGGAALLAGFVLLVLALVLLSQGRLRLHAGLPAGPSHAYVESFAIYLLGMIGGSVVIEIIGHVTGSSPPFVVHLMPLAIAVVVAMGWATVRGAPWGVLCRDVGLHRGRGTLKEIGCGIVGYLVALPLIGVMLALTALLTQLSGDSASHPLVDELPSTSPIVLLLIAAVFAPMTEELLFRGLLLSHLRGASRRFAGALVGPLVVGLIFASIHPQGWLGIPMLTAIGAAFGVIRVWRDSLIAPIVAHAINNGAVVTFMLLLARLG